MRIKDKRMNGSRTAYRPQTIGRHDLPPSLTRSVMF